MKWGQVIKENILWKWQTRYISYDVLKQIIMILSSDSSPNSATDASKLHTKFASILNTDLSKVDAFFNAQQQILFQQYHAWLLQFLQSSKLNGGTPSKSDSKDKSQHVRYCLIKGLKSLLVQFNELKSYAFLNAEGFRKIIKKYDKRLSADTRSTYYPLFAKCNFYHHDAVKKKIEEIVKVINDSNINANRLPSHTPQSEAVSSEIFEHEHVIDEFLNQIDDQNLFEIMDASSDEKLIQLFQHFVRTNKYDAVEAMIHYAENKQILQSIINCRGYLGNTPLMTCCGVSGSVKMASLLLENGADIRLRNAYNRTVFHLAARHGYNELMKMLLYHIDSDKLSSALLYRLDTDMHSCLHLACLRKKYVACKLLIEHGQSKLVNQPNADGLTPLMIVCGHVRNNGYLDHNPNMVSSPSNSTKTKQHKDENDEEKQNKQELMALLLKHCSDINQRDWRLRTALHYVCESGNDSLLQILLKHQVDPYVFDHHGQSAVHIAAKHGYTSMVVTICEYAKTYQAAKQQQQQSPQQKQQEHVLPIYDCTDQQGRTALHLAAGEGREGCARYLLSIGANANITDCFSCNAHSYASLCGVWNDQCPIQRLDGPESLTDLHALNLPDNLVLDDNAVSFMQKQQFTTSTNKKRRRSSSPNLRRELFSDSNGCNKCVVKFKIICDTEPTQYLCIIGDCEELGNWDITKGVKMHRNVISVVPSDDESEQEESKRSEPSSAKQSHRKLLSAPTESEEYTLNEMTTWICQLHLAQGKHIKYKYIVCTYSSLQSWESLPTERSAMISDSMIIDDGVFGMIASGDNNAVATHREHRQSASKEELMNTENELNFDDGNLPILASTPSNPALATSVSSTSTTQRYVQSGWLSHSDAQLHIRLGHITKQKKRAPLIVNNNLYIDRIVIRSGYINKNRYRGIHININMPLQDEDKLKVYKFQSNLQQINALCSLEFEFFPRFSRQAMAKVFVLPSQILSEPVGQLTLALLSTNGLLIGEFNFEYTLIRPFKHDNLGNVLCKTFQHRPEYNTSILIGHRGTGSHGSAELPGPRRTHIKENTILAFNTAKSFGADFVEFDVQLTKDKVPIIYHDFLFPVGPFKIPINKITFRELQAYNKQMARERTPTHRRVSDEKNGKSKSPKNDEITSVKVKASGDEHLLKQNEAISMKKSMSANFQAMKNVTFLEDNLCSLSDVFKYSPINLGLNIEVKYPNYDELILHGIDNVVDINEYCDRILSTVFDYMGSANGAKRYIIFSSFQPDICKCLALKQPQFPVLFLTEGGKKKNFDLRTNSLQNAIYFAKSNHLFGIVTNVAVTLQSPQLINIVHSYGLLLLTYGEQNNDTKMVDLQLKYGIDGVISDHVQYIKTHLDSKSQL